MVVSQHYLIPWLSMARSTTRAVKIFLKGEHSSFVKKKRKEKKDRGVQGSFSSM